VLVYQVPKGLLLQKSMAVRLGGSRRLLSSSNFFTAMNEPVVQHVFDRDLKRTQRDIAATRPNSAEYDYIRDEISDRLVDRLLDIKRDFRTVLDLGCHSGHIAKSLQKQSERLGEGDSLMGIESLTQVDRSEKMLKRDEDLVVLPSSVQHEMLVADEEDLPFESESFDLIISNLSLHWVNNLPGTLSQDIFLPCRSGKRWRS